MPTVEIALPHHVYEVRIQQGSLGALGTAVRDVAPAPRCAVFADRNVFAQYGKLALTSLRDAGYDPISHVLEPGEAQKNMEAVTALWQVLLDHRLDRRSPVVALGGGVTGDTVGFAAATYLRGVPFIQVPTTLLAMVDSSVGGKTGVNVAEGKNLIGAFHQPAVVIIDPALLATLPARELSCGLAECIKHAVIRDADLFAFMRDRMADFLALNNDALAELVARNVAIKAAVVVEDEREQGIRAHLNFGHTFGHAIERTVGYGEILHGEAVALGMVAAAATAATMGLCDVGLEAEIRDIVESAGLPSRAVLPDDRKLDAATRLDKKIAADRLRFVLPTRLGHVEIRDDVAPEHTAAGWKSIRA